MTTCIKCGQEVPSRMDLEDYKAKQKVALYLSTAFDGTYPADVSRKTGLSRGTADFYLNMLIIEQEGYQVDIGRVLFYPYQLVKGLGNYPGWSYEMQEQVRVSKFRFSVVRKQGYEQKLLRVQQHIMLRDVDQHISGICVPVESLQSFIQMLEVDNDGKRQHHCEE